MILSEWYNIVKKYKQKSVTTKTLYKKFYYIITYIIIHSWLCSKSKITRVKKVQTPSNDRGRPD